MIAVIQRVARAAVTIGGNVKASIDAGLMVLVGIEDADDHSDIEWLSSKIVNLRVFDDAEGLMNRSVSDVDGDIIIVSQFTLHASTKKGNRPSYLKASKPDVAIPVYKKFIDAVSRALGKAVQTGEFGAYMQVELVNDGPVTIIIDTRNRV